MRVSESGPEAQTWTCRLTCASIVHRPSSSVVCKVSWHPPTIPSPLNTNLFIHSLTHLSSLRNPLAVDSPFSQWSVSQSSLSLITPRAHSLHYRLTLIHSSLHLLGCDYKITGHRVFLAHMHSRSQRMHSNIAIYALVYKVVAKNHCLFGCQKLKNVCLLRLSMPRSFLTNGENALVVHTSYTALCLRTGRFD